MREYAVATGSPYLDVWDAAGQHTAPQSRPSSTMHYTRSMLTRYEGAIQRFPWQPNGAVERVGAMAWLLFLTILPAQSVSAQGRSLAATAVGSELRVVASLTSSVTGAPGPTIAVPANEEGASSRIPWVLLGAGTGALLGGVIGHNKHVDASSANPDSSISRANVDLNTAVGFLEGGIVGALAGLIVHAVLRP